MQLKAAIGSFFVEFSRFESQCVGAALRSLSKDSAFVEHAEKLLDFEARLKLLERMAFARAVPPALLAELEALLLRARKLHDSRQDVARNLMAFETDGAKPTASATRAKIKPLKSRKAAFAQLAQLAPALTDIEQYASEAIELQESLGTISTRIDRHLLAMPAYA